MEVKNFYTCKVEISVREQGYKTSKMVAIPCKRRCKFEARRRYQRAQVRKLITSDFTPWLPNLADLPAKATEAYNKLKSLHKGYLLRFTGWAELAELFGVTEATAHHRIEKLEEQGLLIYRCLQSDFKGIYIKM